LNYASNRGLVQGGKKKDSRRGILREFEDKGISSRACVLKAGFVIARLKGRRGFGEGGGKGSHKREEGSGITAIMTVDWESPHSTKGGGE